jgi:hypothetical protein
VFLKKKQECKRIGRKKYFGKKEDGKKYLGESS